MISLRITLGSGKEYNIRNTFKRSIKEWIVSSLMPHGPQLLWCEILPGIFVQVSQIQEIRELTDEELAKLPVIKREKLKKKKIKPKDKFSMLKNNKL